MQKLMMTTVWLLFGLVGLMAAQNDSKSIPTASCSFQDGKQMTVRYTNDRIQAGIYRQGRFGHPAAKRCCYSPRRL